MGLTNKSLEVKLDKLTDVVTNLVSVVAPKEEPKVEPTAVTNNVEYADPSVEALFKAEAKLISKLAEGGNTKMVRTKRGIMVVNEVEDSLNAIMDLMRERKVFRRSFMKG